jgi:hypothetical protein
MADSLEIDAALVAHLQQDAALAALVPDGVYFGAAAPGLRAFVIVSLVTALDAAVFGSRGLETISYLVKAVTRDASAVTAWQAAARIDVLLEDQVLTVPGYGWGAMCREERIRLPPEVDSLDETIRWQHFGGIYRVQVTPIGS